MRGVKQLHYLLTANEENNKIACALNMRTYACKVCGKTFDADPVMYQWKYTDQETSKTSRFCSYTCFRKWEKPILERAQARMRREFRIVAACDEYGEQSQTERKVGRPRKAVSA